MFADITTQDIICKIYIKIHFITDYNLSIFTRIITVCMALLCAFFPELFLLAPLCFCWGFLFVCFSHQQLPSYIFYFSFFQASFLFNYWFFAFLPPFLFHVVRFTSTSYVTCCHFSSLSSLFPHILILLSITIGI